MHIIVFSGYNQRSIITFLRTLVKHNIDFSIIAKSEDDNIFLTEYKDKVIAIREKTELDFDDIKRCIQKIKVSFHIEASAHFLIAPSTEALNRFILDNRDKFEKLNCEIPLVDKNLYSHISDKSSFSELCSKYKIDVPEQIENKPENIPFVAKPKTYFDIDNNIFSPVLILNNDDYSSFNSNYNADNFFYQKYLEGKSYYLLYYFYKNGKIVKFSQENLVQQAKGKSIVAAISSDIHNKDISKKFENLFLNLNFYGLVMVELRQHNDKYYMIEANPRFWGPSQLFYDAGINFFEHFLVDNGLDIKINEKNIISNAKYFWNGGFETDNVYFNINWSEFNELYPQFLKSEIYNRKDSSEIFKQETIKKLIKNYSNISKHSQYQILAEDLQKYLPDLKIKSRSEKPRLDYILKNLDIKNQSLIDIGANTGYFTFELLKNGIKSAVCYEGNSNHAMFIKDSANILNYSENIKVYIEYYNFKDTNNYDIMLLLNVLHHIGDDYGDKTINIEKAKKIILEQLNSVASITKTLVFQLGFNWKGDRNICLFKNGLKQELIEYIKQGTTNYWNIKKIGIAEKISNDIVYKDLNSENIKRNDSLGEFLNRPLFIMESKFKNG